jgi:hypothetical protein
LLHGPPLTYNACDYKNITHFVFEEQIAIGTNGVYKTAEAIKLSVNQDPYRVSTPRSLFVWTPMVGNWYGIFQSICLYVMY